MVRCFLKFCGLFVFNILYRVSVTGAEHVPREGGVILAPRHCSFLDPMVLFHFSPRPFHAVVAKRIYDIKLLGWVFRGTGCIPTGGSFDKLLSKLHEDKAVLVFPEGRCGDGDCVRKVHTGIAFLALRSGAPVVPIWVEGAYAAWPTTRKFPYFFRSINIQFRKPLVFRKVQNEKDVPPQVLKRTLQDIMQAINGCDWQCPRKKYEKRKHPRFKPKEDFRCEFLKDGRLYEGIVIKDISAGGLGVWSKKAIEKGVPLEIRMFFPGEDEPVKVTSEVVWCSEREGNEFPYRIGIQYLDFLPNKERFAFLFCNLIENAVSNEEDNE